VSRPRAIAVYRDLARKTTCRCTSV
jgi:hypothetical protein